MLAERVWGHIRRGALAVVWFGACTAGFSLLSQYALTPGKAAPSGGRLAAPRDGYLLSVFIHPLCPCSQATLSEMAVLLGQCPSLSAELHFVKHHKLTYRVQDTALWQEAIRLPRTRLVVDADGGRASSLGAATSGQAFLADKNGDMIFSGGITGARGHAGDNMGSRTIRELAGGGSRSATNPVFGCPLFD